MFCHGELARPAGAALSDALYLMAPPVARSDRHWSAWLPLVLPAYLSLRSALPPARPCSRFQVRRRHPVFVAWRSWRCFSRSARVHGRSTISDGTLLATGIFTEYCVCSCMAMPIRTRHRSLMHGTILTAASISSPISRDGRRRITRRRPRRTRARIHASDHPPAQGRSDRLGAGTLATYGSKGDIYRFYDINPAVIVIANRDFTISGQRRDYSDAARRREAQP
jgi:hypothetical protein